MLTTTLPSLRCPKRNEENLCGAELSLQGRKTIQLPNTVKEVRSGELLCERCSSRFPILAGVAVLVDDVRGYLLSHVKGIAQTVPDGEIPDEYLEEFLEAREEIQIEHIEEDLEAERVISLYLMNHYLSADQVPRGGDALMDRLIREYWGNGPLNRISQTIEKLAPVDSLIDLGCGVGGLQPRVKNRVGRYLGIDSSFASIALARHLALGMEHVKKPKIPSDLLQGPVSVEPAIAPAKSCDGNSDFVVGDLENLPAAQGSWAVSVAMNAIDMLPEPALLPRLQHQLLKSGGVAIQSCPYVWHSEVVRELREVLPPEITESARAVEWLYGEVGLRLEQRIDHVPWLFFKHLRQLEIYSVHILQARKS